MNKGEQLLEHYPFKIIIAMQKLYDNERSDTFILVDNENTHENLTISNILIFWIFLYLLTQNKV